jgi:predicted transcriptional regulator
MVIDMRNKSSFAVSRSIWLSNLSRSAKMTYASLLALDNRNQMRPDDVARVSGYSVRTVYRALRELADYGVIEHSYGYIDILQ